MRIQRNYPQMFSPADDQDKDGFKASDKTGFDYRPFSFLNFPGAAILDFMTCDGCSIVSHKRTSNE